jgi:hypothetical protein
MKRWACNYCSKRAKFYLEDHRNPKQVAMVYLCEEHLRTWLEAPI